MKRLFAGIALGICVLLAVVFVFRGPLLGALKDFLTADMFVAVDADAFNPGVPIGEPFPPIAARYDGEVISELSRFMGENGMVLVANRSADWCFYCMTQYLELQRNLSDFKKAGIGVAAITYDPPELQAKFIDENGIDYPFISDIEARTVIALGILNEEYQPGDAAYGIPHPGVFVLDPQMNIAGKLFIEAYSTRVKAAGVLAYARRALGLENAGSAVPASR